MRGLCNLVIATYCRAYQGIDAPEWVAQVNAIRPWVDAHGDC